jgi:type I restriction enzyme S subunit
MLLRANNITEFGIATNDVLYVPEGRVSPKQRLLPGDILIAASSGSLEVVGKAAQVERPIDATFGAFCKVVRPSADVNPGYLASFFQTDRYRRTVSSLAAGANINNLRNEHIDNLELPIPWGRDQPDLNEQERIVAILGKAEGIRRSRREAFSLANDLLRSLFLEMFGDPHGWDMQTVETMLANKPNSIRTGPFGSQLLHGEFVDSGIAVLGIDNAVRNEFRWGKPRFITPEKYAQLQRYTVYPDDLIITIMGTVGRCAVVPKDIPLAINTKHLCCLTLDNSKCLPEFLHAYFLYHPIAARHLRQACKGAIMDGLNMGVIKSLPVPAVPMTLQERFKAIASKVRRTKDRIAAHGQEADNLFQSLQQRAFAGAL